MFRETSRKWQLECEEGKMGGQGSEKGRLCRTSWATVRTLTFILNEVGVVEDSKQRKHVARLRCSQAPSGHRGGNKLYRVKAEPGHQA